MKTATKREFNSTLNTVKVMFLDKKYNYETDVSASSTLKSTTEYFVGKYFNVGTYPKENMQKCTKIIFYKNPKNQPKTKLNAPMKTKTTTKKKTVRGLKTVCNRVIKQPGLKVDGTLRKGWHYVKGKPTKTVAKKKPTTTKRKVAAKKTTKKKSGLLGLGILGIL